MPVPVFAARILPLLARPGCAVAAGLTAIGALVAAGVPAVPRDAASISGAQFHEVAAVSATDAWAVGLGRGSLILHWDGHRWTQS